MATLKSDDEANTASLAIDVDTVQELELTSTSISYEVVSGEIDVSGLANGKHSVDIKLKSSDVAGISSSDLVDVMIVK